VIRFLLCKAVFPIYTASYGGCLTFNAHRRLMALDALRQVGVQTEGFCDPMEYEESAAWPLEPGGSS